MTLAQGQLKVLAVWQELDTGSRSSLRSSGEKWCSSAATAGQGQEVGEVAAVGKSAG